MMHETFIRYISILRSVAKGPKTLEQIRFEYENVAERRGFNPKLSTRTFLRDKDNILTIFNIEIVTKCNGPYAEYYLDSFDLSLITEKKPLLEHLALAG